MLVCVVNRVSNGVRQGVHTWMMQLHGESAEQGCCVR